MKKNEQILYSVRFDRAIIDDKGNIKEIEDKPSISIKKIFSEKEIEAMALIWGNADGKVLDDFAKEIKEKMGINSDSSFLLPFEIVKRTDFTKNIQLHIKVQNKPEEWRLGQAYFNYAWALYPEETNQLRGTEYDCFYNDERIPDFLEKLNEKLLEFKEGGNKNETK